ncbi:MAG: precorrin-2 C(20)-methyltransferase [Acidimicrobiales bacterium]
MTEPVTRAAGRLIGVGVGPGDPGLVTVAALAALSESDRVVAPTLALDAEGRAESIVRQARRDTSITRLVFDMTPDVQPPNADGSLDRVPGQEHGPTPSQTRAGSYRSAAESLVGWLDAGEQVAFITLGDPNIFSTFSALSAEVSRIRPSVEIRTIPGIMAFQALAAASSTVLLDGTEALSVVTALDGPERARVALSDPERAVVIYKGGRYLPEITECLADAGRLEGAVAGELLGLPGERWGPVKEVGASAGTYLSTVIVPPVARLRAPT